MKTIDLQRKVYDAAIRSAISAKFLQDQLLVVDSLTLESNDKSLLLQHLNDLKLVGKRIYFMYGNEEPERNLILASEQLENKPKSNDLPLGEKACLVSSVRNISVTPVMSNELLVVDKKAVEVLEEMYNIN